MKIASSKNQFEIQDPTKQYPEPNFPTQTQPVPGLAREMDPKPDHIEEFTDKNRCGHLRRLDTYEWMLLASMATVEGAVTVADGPITTAIDQRAALVRRGPPDQSWTSPLFADDSNCPRARRVNHA